MRRGNAKVRLILAVLKFIRVIPGCALLAQARNPYALRRRLGAERNTGVMDSGLALRAPRNDELNFVVAV
jgi:hypothetical protein